MAPHAQSPHEENGHFFSPPEVVLPNGGPQKQPNILFVIADQLSAPFLKMHDPESKIQTPNIDKLAETGVVFDRAYCNAPLCAPSRFVMLAGQLPSKIGAYDNASPMNSDIPTFAHYLRKEGYETTLAGKMHFIGKEQHHGYENRLTPDIYPADFGWTVNWDNPDERPEWYHNMSSVLQAGVAARTNQLDYDEEVIFKSTQYLYDHVRSEENSRKPFFLTVSMTHPHDPYAISRSYWDRYEGVDIPLPKVEIDREDQDPHSKRLMHTIDLWDHPMPEESKRRARRAYYGACSYVDDQVGKLLNVLKDCELDDNTIVIFSSDHGDMLGERGLWYKMSWFENSARVPLVINFPQRFAPRRVPENVSTMDLLPTLVEMVGGRVDTRLPLDGKSLYPALFGHAIPDEVLGEYMGEGSISPVIMIKRGNWKYTSALFDPPQLFDLGTDPQELHNLANEPSHATVAADFAAEVAQRWNLQHIHQNVLQSQRQRRICWEALTTGKWEPWDFQARDDSSQRYIRSNIPLDTLELRARYPPVDALGKRFTTTKVNGSNGVVPISFNVKSG
ncbi:choline-sulfatase [Microthyrium microscopicum]|uniref:Choline-sulfatase n=1 Tax=Microthyrium microscopicum TaxID=703497 RepID=A0A6A6U5J2_9PEZI|nr:choline-sulfatase [Microthyrium microscopicum]